VSEFVDACRREWTRLGVPDPAANEMAADLEADLAEAAAEGVAAEEVLGAGAFDPQSFAVSWAAERGLIPLPAGSAGPGEPDATVSTEPKRTRRPWRLLVLAALVVSGFVALVGGALATQPSGSAEVFQTANVKRFVFPPPTFKGVVVPKPGPVEVHLVHHAPTFGLVLLLVGLVGLVLSILYCLAWFRRGGPGPSRPSYP
jgi:hypothetical protein